MLKRKKNKSSGIVLQIWEKCRVRDKRIGVTGSKDVADVVWVTSRRTEDRNGTRRVWVLRTQGSIAHSM